MQHKRKADERFEAGDSTQETQSKRSRSLDPFEDLEAANGEAVGSPIFNIPQTARKEVPTVDTTYGQRGAIPGLDDEDDEDSEESGDAEGGEGLGLSTREAMAYLRIVR